MQPEHIYESWKQGRARANVPADFADRVMASLDLRDPTGPVVDVPGWLGRWFASPLGTVGLCAVGFLVFLLRMGSVIALFLELAGKVEGAS
jgi:hypothetical protein